MWDKCQVKVYKMIALVPLMVTFGLYGYLSVYYIYFYLKPTIEMKFDSISFDA